jgi:hypothetical protein
MMHVDIINKQVNFTQPSYAFGQVVTHNSGQEGIVVGMKFTGNTWAYEVCFLKPLAISKPIPELELKPKMIRAKALTQ